MNYAVTPRDLRATAQDVLDPILGLRLLDAADRLDMAHQGDARPGVSGHLEDGSRPTYASSLTSPGASASGPFGGAS